MKKTDGPTLLTILICIILVIFVILVFTSVSETKEITNNSSNIPTEEENNIYYEKEVDNTSEVTNLTKESIELSTYTTNIYDKDENRVYNIKLACKTLNGHIVAKGEEFSFNDKLGNMGEAEGYKKALGFDSNGKDIQVFGGGICQLSSTLYNAVLIAKLEVTERHAHSKRVHYVPKNKDATVFAGGPDLKFKNTSDGDIIINASTDGYKVSVSLTQEKIIEKE